MEHRCPIPCPSTRSMRRCCITIRYWSSPGRETVRQDSMGAPRVPPTVRRIIRGALLLDPVTGNITQFSVSWDMFCNAMITLARWARIHQSAARINYSPFEGGADFCTSSISATNLFTEYAKHGARPLVSHRYRFLPDGQVMTFSGFDENGEITNTSGRNTTR